jgi:hypothetical protein
MANSLYSSSSLQLFDSVTNDSYTVSTFSDRVEHNSRSKPQHFHGSSVKFYNNNGTNTFSDVVVDLNILKAGQVADRLYTDASAKTESDALNTLNSSITSLLIDTTSSRNLSDYILQNSVTTNKSAIASSVAAALSAHQLADASLKAIVDLEVKALVNDVTLLKNDLDAEVTRAITAEKQEYDEYIASDASLRANLDLETSRAMTSEQKEVDNRTNADASLLNQIEQRTADRLVLVQVERARIDAILANNSVDLNKLKEIVEAYNALDAKQATEITDLTATCALLQFQVDALKTKIDIALTKSDVRGMGKK